MKTYHHFMMVTLLVLSAVAFKIASWFIGRAIVHKSKLNILIDREIESKYFGG